MFDTETEVQTDTAVDAPYESSAPTTKRKPGGKNAPVWDQETTWLGPDGVRAKIDRESAGNAYPHKPPAKLKALLARPEWKGSTVTEGERETVKSRDQHFDPMRKTNHYFPYTGTGEADTVKIRSETLQRHKPPLGMTFKVWIITHPDGTVMIVRQDAMP